ncbi:MAG: helix-turn-helix transcriptional regulator [Clostridia bacterium]|nr:helix-turn-helix transcriptional regulator [Clostridia bacterium]
MNNLKNIRKLSGLTQADVARILGCTPQAYQRYEQNEREADHNTLCKLATIFNVSTDYLLGHLSQQNFPNLKLSDLINYARGQRSLEEFAKACAIDVEELKKIIDRQTQPTFVDLRKIADNSFNKVSLEALVFSSGIKPTIKWTDEEKATGVIPEYKEQLSADEIELLDAYRAIKDEKGEKAAHAIKTIVLTYLDAN